MSNGSEHISERPWEYGFYDSATGPTRIWWSTFGGLVDFDSVEMAEHTAQKSTYGAPVIVRRPKGETEWVEVEGGDTHE